MSAVAHVTQRIRGSPPRLRSRVVTALVLAGVLVGLYLVSLCSYLFFHVLAELASISVAVGTFIVAWHSRQYHDKPYLLFLGTSYLAAGVLDLLHTLTYKGMGVLPIDDANLPTQLWLAARFLQSASLVVFPVILRRRPSAPAILWGYVVAVAALLGTVLGGVFPVAYVEGQGLTPFKIVSEYVISGLFVLAIGHLLWRREALSPRIARLLVASMAAAAVSELLFTSYVGVYDAANLLGHFAKLVSFYFVYRAIIVTGLEDPYALLFRSVRLSEEGLALERDNLRGILEAMPDGVYIVDDEYTVVYANPAMLREFGEVGGRKCYNYLHGNDGPCATCPNEQVFTGQTVRYEWTSRRGKVYDVVDTPLQRPGGRPAKLKIHRDITELRRATEALQEARDLLERRVRERTAELEAVNLALQNEIEERKRTEEMLRKAEERFRVALRSGQIIVAHTDRDLRYTWIYNPHPDFAAEELVGRRDDEVFPPEQAKAIVAMKRRVLETGQLAREELGLPLEGGLRTYDVVAEPLLDAEGGVAGVTLAALDITERREAERALVHAERLTLTGKLAASLAHEIKNPLQSIIGCMGLAREAVAAGGDADRYFDVAREELQRVNNLVSQLRDLHAAPAAEERVPTDVNELVERVVALSRKEASGRSVEIVTELESDIPALNVGRGQIQQVFLNLLLNALDAMPDGGTLSISTRNGNPADAVAVTFADTGVGMPPDVARRVFEDFFTTKKGGLGLGLFVSDNIVKQHGGRIDLETREGVGTTFTVWLPR